MAIDTIEKSLFATLTNESSGIIAIIGTRCFPVVVPGGSLFPAITYKRSSGAQLKGHDGRPGFDIADFEVRCHGKTYKSAKDLAEQVKRHLNGFSGQMGGGLTVQGATLTKSWDGDQDTDPDVFVVYQEYRIPFKN